MNRRSILKFLGLAPLAAAMNPESKLADGSHMLATSEIPPHNHGYRLSHQYTRLYPPEPVEAGELAVFVYDGTRWVKLDWPQAS